ncbi:hypothetical protein, partial [Klebsiella pneumoniae]|uniref:hypothetical protein n=1 Tax=Klebsiella pneumoniae TaxID=573 RepID=UPI0010255F39
AEKLHSLLCGFEGLTCPVGRFYSKILHIAKQGPGTGNWDGFPDGFLGWIYRMAQPGLFSFLMFLLILTS